MIQVLMNIFAPLLGLGMPAWLITTVFLCKRGFGAVMFGMPLMSGFSSGIPTFFAAQYWRSGALVRFWLPLLCMTLFVVHPTGAQSWVYSLYWFIPAGIYLSSYRSFFAHALACTFIQHAVGSVIYLYCVPSTAALWYSLLPLVAFERLMSASGMVSVAWLMQRAVGLYGRYFRASIVQNA